MKTCRICGGPIRRNNLRGICSQNYKCMRAANRLAEQKWRDGNREKKRADGRKNSRKYSLSTMYKLSLEDYQGLLDRQGNACAICREEFSVTPCVDHDHSCCPGDRSCGKCVRGLLCHNCNHMIGKAKDDPARLLAAVRYLGG